MNFGPERSAFSSNLVCRPCPSIGTVTYSAPIRSNACSAPRYVGDSTRMRSPRLISSLAIRSSACCEPDVIITLSTVATMPYFAICATDQLAQRLVAFRWSVLQRCGWLCCQYLLAGLAEALDREYLRRGQAASKRNDFRFGCEFQELANDGALCRLGPLCVAMGPGRSHSDTPNYALLSIISGSLPSVTQSTCLDGYVSLLNVNSESFVSSPVDRTPAPFVAAECRFPASIPPPGTATASCLTRSRESSSGLRFLRRAHLAAERSLCPPLMPLACESSPNGFRCRRYPGTAARTPFPSKRPRPCERCRPRRCSSTIPPPCRYRGCPCMPRGASGNCAA